MVRFRKMEPSPKGRRWVRMTGSAISSLISARIREKAKGAAAKRLHMASSPAYTTPMIGFLISNLISRTVRYRRLP